MIDQELTQDAWDPQAFEPEEEGVPYLDYETPALPLTEEVPQQFRRSKMILVAFLAPVAFTGLSYALGGVPFITDLGFIILSVLCIALSIVELVKFGSRQGIGALLIYAGVFIWFCHDYLQNWMGHQFNGAGDDVTAAVVARAAFYHCIFVECMLISLRWQIFRWVDRMVVIIPEPADPRFYLWVLLFGCAFGMSEFLFAHQFPYCIIKAPLWFWLGGPEFFVGRSGNANYNWGGYVAQIQQAGTVAGVFGAFYAILIARSAWGKILGWGIWLFWTSFSFEGYRRGDIAFMGVPVVALVFVKYQAQAAKYLKPFKVRYLVMSAVVAFAMYYAVMWETMTRMGWESVDLARVGGNSMFSEGIRAWPIYPAQRPFVRDTFFGANVVRPIPDALLDLVIGPIPRALWTTKPLDEFAASYSSMMSSDTRTESSGGRTGTTVAMGAAGAWYFHYGPVGIIEGGLFYGFLMGVAERSLRRAGLRPMGLLMSLGFATFMFRCYRDLWWHMLYPLMIGGIVMGAFILVFSPTRRQVAWGDGGESDGNHWAVSGV